MTPEGTRLSLHGVFHREKASKREAEVKEAPLERYVLCETVSWNKTVINDREIINGATVHGRMYMCAYSDPHPVGIAKPGDKYKFSFDIPAYVGTIPSKTHVHTVLHVQIIRRTQQFPLEECRTSASR